MGAAVDGAGVVGDADVGDADVGESVVGDAVIGTAVVGAAVVGAFVGESVTQQVHMRLLSHPGAAVHDTPVGDASDWAVSWWCRCRHSSAVEAANGCPCTHAAQREKMRGCVQSQVSRRADRKNNQSHHRAIAWGRAQERSSSAL